MFTAAELHDQRKIVNWLLTEAQFERIESTDYTEIWDAQIDEARWERIVVTYTLEEVQGIQTVVYENGREDTSRVWNLNQDVQRLMRTFPNMVRLCTKGMDHRDETDGFHIVEPMPNVLLMKLPADIIAGIERQQVI
jgi:hypothetical protein